MTDPAPVPIPQPAPGVEFPAVFGGVGALVVNCALDPDVLADKIPNLTWVAVKTNGTDIAPDTETLHCVARWRARGMAVGSWVWCAGPPATDVMDTHKIFAPTFVIYDVESPYKSDEGGHYEWAAQLVTAHDASLAQLPAAVTSYGGYKTTIDFGSFAHAGWPILAQVYDAFHDGDEASYGAVYPPVGIHRLTRRLQLVSGESVYRPESV